jgi:hypothetical protein
MKQISILAVVLALSVPVFAGIKLRVDFEKEYDFSKVKTVAWSDGVGDIMLARSTKDDPDAMRERAQPIIVNTVASVLPARGLQLVKDKADLTLRYYMLLTIGNQNQYMGQFVPSVLDWGLPLFAPATTSYKVINSGSLVLDLRAADKVVWRAVAEAEIQMDAPAAKREKILTSAVTDAFAKYPPKQKK